MKTFSEKLIIWFTFHRPITHLLCAVHSDDMFTLSEQILKIYTKRL